MEEAITFAKKYLEDVLSFFGLNVDVHATHDEDVIELNIPSTHLNGFLIGQRGDTVRALQYMVMSALKNKKFEYMRVNVDVADYKKAQNDRLAEQVEQWAAEVKSSKKNMELRPMTPAYRRIDHKVASENSRNRISGRGYDRRVIIKTQVSTQKSLKPQNQPRRNCQRRRKPNQSTKQIKRSEPALKSQTSKNPAPKS